MGGKEVRLGAKGFLGLGPGRRERLSALRVFL
jgi:hypothetical protein